MSVVKEAAKKLIEALPESATWDDLMYEFYVKQKLAQALKEADQGDVISHERAKEQLSSK